MQAGFTLLEAGSCRGKNQAHIIMKNIIDASVGAVCWWLVGWGLAYGDRGARDATTDEYTNGFMGTQQFLPGDEKMLDVTVDGESMAVNWFFQYAFCATAATITKGGMAERVRLEGYLVIAFILCTITYPLIVHWTWGNGWLGADAQTFGTEGEGYSDFAGSGIVHLTGGITALFGAIVLGPRIGRFDGTKPDDEFLPSNITAVALGTLILWFGWYGFNCGSTLGMAGAGLDMGRVAVATTLGAACGGIASFMLSSVMRRQFDLVAYCNGILGGLVSVTAGCGFLEPGYACISGLIGGCVYVMSSKMLESMHIDDPIGAFPVHGACGVWGCLANGLFSMSGGWFYTSFGMVFWPNLIMCVVIIVWCAITTVPAMIVLKMMGLFRVDAEIEETGFDASLYGSRSDRDMSNTNNMTKTSPA